jgi:hypothetical protein
MQWGSDKNYKENWVKVRMCDQGGQGAVLDRVVGQEKLPWEDTLQQERDYIWIVAIQVIYN